MSSDEGIPIFMFGRSAEIAAELIPIWRPDIDVVHFCDDPDDAKRELPAVIKGEAVKSPSKPLGSNTQRLANNETPRKPVGLFVGAGFDEEQYLSLRHSIGDDHGLTWIRELKSDLEGREDDENWVTVNGQKRPAPRLLEHSVRKAVFREMKVG